MKTIAVVTIPFGNMTPEQNSNATTSIKESLPDYDVIVFASSRSEKISIEFFSPELQAKENLKATIDGRAIWDACQRISKIHRE